MTLCYARAHAYCAYAMSLCAYLINIIMAFMLRCHGALSAARCRRRCRRYAPAPRYVSAGDAAAAAAAAASRASAQRARYARARASIEVWRRGGNAICHTLLPSVRRQALSS